MRLNFLLLLFVFIGLVACEKETVPDNYQQSIMPKTTQLGANTLGCYVDGELFVAKEGSSVWDLPRLWGGYDEESGDFRMQACRYQEVDWSDDEKLDYVVIHADNIHEPGVYFYDLFNGDGDGLRGYNNAYYPDGCEYYFDDTPEQGRLVITHLDKEKNIIVGTFNFVVYNADCEGDKTKEITKGKFDCRYSPQ